MLEDKVPIAFSALNSCPESLNFESQLVALKVERYCFMIIIMDGPNFEEVEWAYWFLVSSVRLSFRHMVVLSYEPHMLRF